MENKKKRIKFVIQIIGGLCIASIIMGVLLVKNILQQLPQLPFP